MVVKTNDDTTVWGVSTKTWLGLFQNLGIPTLFMLFVCYLAYQWVPPVATAHIDLLKRTGDTLESMDATLKQSNKMLEALGQQKFPDLEWRAQVIAEHATNLEEIRKIGDKIDKLKSGAE